MTDKRESPEETRARLLYIALKHHGDRLTVQQYRTIRGEITAGQYELAEGMLRKAGARMGGKA